MGKIHLAALVFVFMMVRRASSVHFIFQAPSYTLEETFGTDNVVATEIMISRTGTAEETNKEQTILLNTNCRSGVTATASDSDITYPVQVTFESGDFEKPVPITIKNDEEHELRELFCLTIATDPGSEYSIVIIIPGNDFCYDVNLAAAADFEIASATYVGPWFPEISDVMEIWITPDPTSTGDGEDINIYLATHADTDDTNLDYYGIFLDDSVATTSHGNAAGSDDESIIIYDIDATIQISDFQAVLTTVNLIDKNNAPNKFWLKYEKSTGTISLGTDVDRVLAAYDWQHGASDAEIVKHVFVSSVETSKSTYIKICHPASPEKIDPVSASSSDDQEGGVANRAKDGERGPDFNDGNCFLSGDETDPWLKVDLGMDYDVDLVLIWPVADNTLNTKITKNSIDGAVVYVGSCDVADIENNMECESTPTTIAVTLTQTVIEKTCDADRHGRYVYIFKNTVDTAMDAFSLCEVEVYGTEIPYGDETEVQFSNWKFDVDEDNMTVTIQANRTGDVLTCTSVDFYTDSSTTPVHGNTDDFEATSRLSPMTFQWGANDANAATKELSVTLNDDDLCEPYETFKVYLTNVIGGTTGAQSSATVGINDDDSVTFSLESDKFTVSEGDQSLSIDILRSGTGTMQPGSAELVFTPGAATSDDYDNEPVPVSFDTSSAPDMEPGVININSEDQRYELDETFTVGFGRLLPPDTCSMTGQYPSAVVTITDDDSEFHWDSDSSISVLEGEERMIDINRDGTVQVKTIDIVIDEGTTEMDDDFSISPSSNGATSVTFRRGESTVPITIEVEDDSVLENEETFTLTLQDPLYPSGNRKDPYRVQITIRDNDAEYSWKNPSYTVQESSGFFPVCLVRTGYDSDKSIGISTDVISGSATIGTDFTPPTSIDFVAGLQEACADVEIKGDTSVEPTETFTLAILSAQDVVLGANNIATVSITDDDNIISWSQTQYTFPEGATDAYVTISKSGTAAVSVTLSVTSGTAILNTDFNLDVSSGSSITIPFGASSHTIAVTINNDQMDEPTESFTLTLTSASSGTISQPRVTIFITDDDLPSTSAPPSGLGGGAIAGIVAAVGIGTIVIIIAVFVFFAVTGSNAAAPATALPLSTYQPGYAGNGIDYGYGNSLNGYGNRLNGYGYYPPYR